jgi:hypothetical protein
LVFLNFLLLFCFKSETIVRTKERTEPKQIMARKGPPQGEDVGITAVQECSITGGLLEPIDFENTTGETCVSYHITLQTGLTFQTGINEEFVEHDFKFSFVGECLCGCQVETRLSGKCQVTSRLDQQP